METFYCGVGVGSGVGVGVGNFTSTLITSFCFGVTLVLIVIHQAQNPTRISNTITISTVLAPESPF
jgi:hypothetical protein